MFDGKAQRRKGWPQMQVMRGFLVFDRIFCLNFDHISSYHPSQSMRRRALRIAPIGAKDRAPRGDLRADA